jgi:hypothetical protein
VSLGHLESYALTRSEKPISQVKSGLGLDALPHCKRDSPIGNGPRNGAGARFRTYQLGKRSLQQATTMVSSKFVRAWPEGGAVLDAVTNAPPGYLNCLAIS